MKTKVSNSRPDGNTSLRVQDMSSFCRRYSKLQTSETSW